MSGVEFLELFGVGAAAGIIGALLGIGGGVVLVPGLSLLLGFELRQAIAASLVCVVATSVAGSVVHLWKRRVHLPLALELQFFAVAGAVGSGLIAVFVPAAPLHFAFALLLLYAATQMIPLSAHPGHDLPFEYVRDRRGLAAAGSLFGGAMAGLLGVGGGIVFVPVLHLLLRRSFIRATATSVFMIGVTAASGALVYLARGDVAPDRAAIAVLGVLAGSGVASAVGHRLDPRPLKIGFALLMVWIAVQMVRRGIAQL